MIFHYLIMLTGDQSFEEDFTVRHSHSDINNLTALSRLYSSTDYDNSSTIGNKILNSFLLPRFIIKSIFN